MFSSQYYGHFRTFRNFRNSVNDGNIRVLSTSETTIYKYRYVTRGDDQKMIDSIVRLEKLKDGINSMGRSYIYFFSRDRLAHPHQKKESIYNL